MYLCYKLTMIRVLEGC